MATMGQTLPLPELQAPVPRPPKLIAAFGNYREGSDRERQTQDMFLESPDSITGPDGTVVLPNHPAPNLHHDGASPPGGRPASRPNAGGPWSLVSGQRTCRQMNARSRHWWATPAPSTFRRG